MRIGQQMKMRLMNGSAVAASLRCRGRARIASLVRVAVLILFATIAIAWLAGRATLARVEDALLEVGPQLGVLAEAGFGRDARVIRINGQKLGFQSRVSELSVGELLDGAENWCRGGRAGDSSWRQLTLRAREGDRGFVACLRPRAVEVSAEALVELTSAFADSGNLADLGSFYYFYVYRGTAAQVLVSAWTEWDFIIDALLPEKGDAIGDDPPGLPRPPGLRRVLTVSEEGWPGRLVVYQSENVSVGDLTAFYRTAIAGNGWRPVADIRSSARRHSLLAERQDQLWTVMVDSEDAEAVTVTVAATP